MNIYVVVKNGVVVEVIKPINDAHGNEIALSSRFTADYIRTLTVCTNVAVALGWTYINGVFAAPPMVSASQLLQNAIVTQIDQLSQACAASIASGFVSNALGTPHTYPAKATDQANIASSVMSAFLARMGGLWQARTSYAVEDTIVMGGIVYRCASAGISGNTQPVFPTTLGALVRDGLVQWDIWATPFWCEDAVGNWAFVPHTSPQMQRVGTDAKQAILNNMVKNATLAAQVQAAKTVAQVQAVVWL